MCTASYMKINEMKMNQRSSYLETKGALMPFILDARQFLVPSSLIKFLRATCLEETPIKDTLLI